MQIKSDPIWKDIPDTNYLASRYGEIKSKKRNKVLKPSLVSGYESVSVHGKRKFVHRLVLLAFSGFPETGFEACHKDGNRRNNRIENLRWDTHKNNLKDNRLNGTSLLGQKNHKSKISDKQAEVVAKIYCLVRMKDLKKHYNLSDVNISHISLGKTRHSPHLSHIYESNKKMAPIRLAQSQKRGFPSGK